MTTHVLSPDLTPQRPVPFFVPDVDADDRAAVDEVLRSGWLTSGPNVSLFETEFAHVVGAEHAVAVNSCTAALQIALRCWGIGPGDEVLLPTMTFASAAEVVLHLGATPVLVDVREDDLTIDIGHAESLVTPRTRVIMPMHYGGQPYDVRAGGELARRHGLLVLDDAAHALPASTPEGSVGSLADATCFSFYANKTMTTGEGGMLVTNDSEWATVCKSLSLHGLSENAWSRFRAGGSWDYDIVRLGYKSNLTDMAAAMGRTQLKRIWTSRDERQRLAGRYRERLLVVDGVEPLAVHDDRRSAWHLFVVRLHPDYYDRNDACAQLARRGIGTSVHYKPLHRHPLMASMSGINAAAYPRANDAYAGILSLPLYPGTSDDDIDYVASSLQEISCGVPA